MPHKKPTRGQRAKTNAAKRTVHKVNHPRKPKVISKHPAKAKDPKLLQRLRKNQKKG